MMFGKEKALAMLMTGMWICSPIVEATAMTCDVVGIKMGSKREDSSYVNEEDSYAISEADESHSEFINHYDDNSLTIESSETIESIEKLWVDSNEYGVSTYENKWNSASEENKSDESSLFKWYFDEESKTIEIGDGQLVNNDKRFNSNKTRAEYIKFNLPIYTAQDLSEMFRGWVSYAIVGADNIDMSQAVDLTGMFSYMNRLTSIEGLGSWDVGNVKSMKLLFRGAINLVEVSGIGEWDVSGVETFDSTFYGAQSIENLDELSNWDVSSAESMANMFNQVLSVKDFNFVNGWDVGNVTTFISLFYDARAMVEVDLTSWNVGMVTDMRNMFRNVLNVESIGDLSHWDVSNVRRFDDFIYTARKLGNIGKLDNWDVSKATHMSNMFYGIGKLTSLGDLKHWDVGNVETFDNMFSGCYSLEEIGDLTEWDVHRSKTFSNMFSGIAASSIGDVSGWMRSENEVSISGMFSGAKNLKSVGDLSAWDVSKVRNATSLFSGASSLESVGDLSGWEVGEIVNFSNMFRSAESLGSIGDISQWNVKNSTSFYSMFADAKGIKSLGDLSQWDVSNSNNLAYMFTRTSIDELGDLNGWDVSKVTDLTSTFSEMKSLKRLTGLDSWNTSLVSSFRHTFGRLHSLEEFSDISKWDTQSVTATSGMFLEWTNTNEVMNLGEWDVSEVTDMSSMFEGYEDMTLVSGLENWDVSKVEDTSKMFRNASGYKDMDIGEWNTESLKNTRLMFEGFHSRNEVINLSNWSVDKLSMGSKMFSNSSGVEVIDLSSWVMEGIPTGRSYDEMFSEAVDLREVSLAGWDISDSIGHSMFSGASSIETIDLTNSKWTPKNSRAIYLDSTGNITTLIVDGMTGHDVNFAVGGIFGHKYYEDNLWQLESDPSIILASKELGVLTPMTGTWKAVKKKSVIEPESIDVGNIVIGEFVDKGANVFVRNVTESPMSISLYEEDSRLELLVKVNDEWLSLDNQVTFVSDMTDWERNYNVPIRVKTREDAQVGVDTATLQWSLAPKVTSEE